VHDAWLKRRGRTRRSERARENEREKKKGKKKKKKNIIKKIIFFSHLSEGRALAFGARTIVRGAGVGGLGANTGGQLRGATQF
jgi:hypothetical protein